MTLPQLLAASPGLVVFLTIIFSLMIGSFLNVVIYRLPIMLDRAWRSEAKEIVESPELPAAKGIAANARFNLASPNSRCPGCSAPIKAYQNIPVFSYLFLKGKCAKCSTAISARYPIVEAFTAALSAVVVWQLGFTWYAGAALVLTWCLIALSVIDFDHQILPDQITLPLVWIGLLISLWPAPDSPFAPDTRSSIIGGVAGYLSLWTVNRLYRLIRGEDGMGYGDLKLLAAFGTWFGWQSLLLIILLASFVGAAVGISLIVFKGRDHKIPIPFGPFLAAAGWIAMLWRQPIIAQYLQLTGWDRGIGR
jgi:leader peptidase (prepilin peptidase) / N-methyltransferase